MLSEVAHSFGRDDQTLLPQRIIYAIHSTANILSLRHATAGRAGVAIRSPSSRHLHSAHHGSPPFAGTAHNKRVGAVVRRYNNRQLVCVCVRARRHSHVIYVRLRVSVWWPGGRVRSGWMPWMAMAVVAVVACASDDGRVFSRALLLIGQEEHRVYICISLA